MVEAVMILLGELALGKIARRLGMSSYIVAFEP
jgi:hypothetical protein